jgi:hypothetical protein
LPDLPARADDGIFIYDFFAKYKHVSPHRMIEIRGLTADSGRLKARGAGSIGYYGCGMRRGKEDNRGRPRSRWEKAEVSLHEIPARRTTRIDTGPAGDGKV